MNGIGPRNFNPNMKADLAKQVKDLGKLDEGKALGEAQQANTDRPEGETEVIKTVIVTWKDPNGGSGSDNISDIVYDGELNGVVVNKYPDGTVYVEVDEHLHNHLATIASDQNN